VLENPEEDVAILSLSFSYVFLPYTTSWFEPNLETQSTTLI